MVRRSTRTLWPRGCPQFLRKFINCVSTEAKHPRLTFHEADLNDLSSLSVRLFKQLEHPWLVVDDAHSNVEGLFHWVDRQMNAGDYYVIEDYLTMPSVEDIQFLLNLGDSYFVDRDHQALGGYNNTCAPNAWLRKNSRGRGPDQIVSDATDPLYREPPLPASSRQPRLTTNLMDLLHRGVAAVPLREIELVARGVACGKNESESSGA